MRMNEKTLIHIVIPNYWLLVYIKPKCIWPDLIWNVFLCSFRAALCTAVVPAGGALLQHCGLLPQAAGWLGLVRWTSQLGSSARAAADTLHQVSLFNQGTHQHIYYCHMLLSLYWILLDIRLTHSLDSLTFTNFQLCQFLHLHIAAYIAGFFHFHYYSG